MQFKALFDISAPLWMSVAHGGIGMTTDMKISHRDATHIGLVRKVNEDSILSLPEHGIWVVSDGMGGHDGGDFASQTIVAHVARIDAKLKPEEMIDALRDALAGAHEEILQETVIRGGDTIGATVVTLVLTDGFFASFWSGDSRLYRYRNGGVELLTRDHSYVAHFVDAGELTWDEAEQHPQSNLITHAVGIDEGLHLDQIKGEVLPGDRFLLCSDGLNKYAGFDTLAEILGRAPLDTVVDELMQVALDGGGADNISIIVVDISGD